MSCSKPDVKKPSDSDARLPISQTELRARAFSSIATAKANSKPPEKKPRTKKPTAKGSKGAKGAKSAENTDEEIKAPPKEGPAESEAPTNEKQVKAKKRAAEKPAEPEEPTNEKQVKAKKRAAEKPAESEAPTNENQGKAKKRAAEKSEVEKAKVPPKKESKKGDDPKPKRRARKPAKKVPNSDAEGAKSDGEEPPEKKAKLPKHNSINYQVLNPRTLQLTSFSTSAAGKRNKGIGWHEEGLLGAHH